MIYHTKVNTKVSTILYIYPAMPQCSAHIPGLWIQAKLLIAPGCWDMRYRQSSARMVLRQHNPRYIDKSISTNILEVLKVLEICTNQKYLQVKEGTYLILVNSISSSASVKKLTENNFSTMNSKRLLTGISCVMLLCVKSYTQCLILH